MSLRCASSDKHQDLASLCHKLSIKEQDLVSAEQVHEDGIALVTAKDKGKQIPGVDALITLEKGVPLVIRTADCAPILIYDPERHILALVHAGRKGTEMEIAAKTVRKLGKMGSNPANLRVKIGPCIAKCCYPMDLRAENLKQLASSGAARENIEVSPDCTCCLKEKYFSYRGDGPATKRNFLIAIMAP